MLGVMHPRSRIMMSEPKRREEVAYAGGCWKNFNKLRHPVHAGQLKASLPCAISPICSGWKRSLTSLSHVHPMHAIIAPPQHLAPSVVPTPHPLGWPTKSTLSASDDAWRCQAPASCQSLDQQACATARSRSSRCMALSYLLLLVPNVCRGPPRYTRTARP